MFNKFLVKIAFQFILTIFCFFNLQAQPPNSNSGSDGFSSSDIVPPTPTASALSKVFEFPVNAFNGTPKINIPLYTLKSGSLKASISLDYSGVNGIKVQDIAGPASTGWTLIAGGVITRTVRDHPDEQGGAIKGYLNVDNTWLSSDTSSNTFKDALRSTLEETYGVGLITDLQPDIFNSTIGGRIVFRPNKMPEFVDQQGYLIKRNGLYDPNGVWEIVDPKGVRYFFGESTSAIEKTASKRPWPTNLSTTFAYNMSSTPTSWYLTKIISASGDVIEFNYEVGIGYETTYYSTSKSKTVFQNGATSGGIQEISIIEAPNPVYIKNIISSEGKATFYYNNRLDNTALRSLEKVVITDYLENKTTSFRFNTSYFSNGAGNANARPKLVSIDQLNVSDNEAISLAKFYYNEDNLLPDRSSTQFDHWGYFNNNTSGKRLLSEGALKAADFAKCKAGILTRIDWPTGGQSKYEYELNSFLEKNQEYSGGGLRIKKVQQVDDNANIKETSYSYLNANALTSGLLQNKFNPDSGYVYKTNMFKLSQTQIQGSSVTEYDIPYYELFDLNGRYVGYSRVIITHPNLSKEVQVFQNYDSFPDQIEKLYLVTKYGGPFNITNRYTPQEYGYFNFRTPSYLQRGLLKEKIYYNDENNKVKKYVYKYASALNPFPIVGIQRRFFTSNTISGSPSSGGSTTTTWYLANYYKIIPQTAQLIGEEVFDYTKAGDSIKIANQSIYRSLYPFLLEKKIESRSKDEASNISTRYFYPDQYAFSGTYWEWTTNSNGDMIRVPRVGNNVYSKMVSANMINEVIEKRTVIEQADQSSSILKNELKIFNDNNPNGLILKGKELSFDPVNLLNANDFAQTQPLPTGILYDTRYKVRMNYNQYDNRGKILEQQQNNGIKEVFIWGYNKEYPISKVANASYQEVSIPDVGASDPYYYGKLSSPVNLYYDIDNSAPLGNNVLDLSLQIGYMTTEGLNLIREREYILNYWEKDGELFPQSSNTDINIFSNKILQTKGSWKLREIVFNNIGGELEFVFNGYGYIQDLKIYPKDAQLTTFTYKPLIGMTSQTDAKGMTTYFEYDTFGRLKNLKDQNGNIIINNSYNYKN